MTTVQRADGGVDTFPNIWTCAKCGVGIRPPVPRAKPSRYNFTPVCCRECGKARGLKHAPQIIENDGALTVFVGDDVVGSYKSG